jgi:hypothetical protein
MEEILVKFKQELRGRQLPPKLKLNGTYAEVAARLLATCAPGTVVSDDGTQMQVMSLQEYATAFLGAFMEEQGPPQQSLLYTIAEEQLDEFAAKHKIAIIKPPKDDVRIFLDRLALRQPQTYSSLCRSSERLHDAAARLRSS